MRRGLTLLTRQLNASHDAEILFYEKHKLIWKSFWDFFQSFCVFSFIQFLYHYSVILHFWPNKTCIEACAELKSSNVRPHICSLPPFPLLFSRKRGAPPKEREGESRRKGGGRRGERKKKEKGKGKGKEKEKERERKGEGKERKGKERKEKRREEQQVYKMKKQ